MGDTLQAKLQLSKCIFPAERLAPKAHNTQATDQGQTCALQIQRELGELSVPLKMLRRSGRGNPQLHSVTFTSEFKRTLTFTPTHSRRGRNVTRAWAPL